MRTKRAIGLASFDWFVRTHILIGNNMGTSSILGLPVLLVESDAGIASNEGHEDRLSNNYSIPMKMNTHRVSELTPGY